MPFGNQITVIEARDWIKNKKDLQLIDIRTQSEFKKKSIKKFQNLPYSQINNEIPNINSKKTTLLMSSNGNDARKAHELLEACGIRSFIIRGGMDDWFKVIQT